jgi:hypothetical protein
MLTDGLTSEECSTKDMGGVFSSLAALHLQRSMSGRQI